MDSSPIYSTYLAASPAWYSESSGSSEVASYLVHFDADRSVERMKNFCKNICRRVEFTKRGISSKDAERQAALLKSLQTGSLEVGMQPLRTHMQYTYIVTWDRDENDKPRKNHGESYRKSTIMRKLCLSSWLALHGTGERIWRRWLQKMAPYDLTPRTHSAVDGEGKNINANK